jgi:NAD/NADP transhydrogenase beta subunit
MKGGEELNSSEKLVFATIIFLLAIGIVLGIDSWVKTVDVSAIPEIFQPIVSIIQRFFGFASVSFTLAYLRNILGYVRNWVILRKTQAVEYQLDRYYNTLLYYFGCFTVALAALPEPYNALGAALVFVVDIFTAEYKKIKGV